MHRHVHLMSPCEWGIPWPFHCAEELESHMSHYKELLHLEDLHKTIHWPVVADLEPDVYVPQVSIHFITYVLWYYYRMYTL